MKILIKRFLFLKILSGLYLSNNLLRNTLGVTVQIVLYAQANIIARMYGLKYPHCSLHETAINKYY